MSAYDEAQRVVRDGEKRIAEHKRQHDEAIMRAAWAGEPLTIAGVRYIPDPGA